MSNTKSVAINLNSFNKPYHDKGHDIQSLFNYPFKCQKCGAYQIDLSEDGLYGDMTECVSPNNPEFRARISTVTLKNKEI